MDIVGNAIFVEELVKLLVVDPMGPFHFAIQMRGSRPNVDVADIQCIEPPVEVRLEFGSIVSAPPARERATVAGLHRESEWLCLACTRHTP